MRIAQCGRRGPFIPGVEVHLPPVCFSEFACVRQRMDIDYSPTHQSSDQTLPDKVIDGEMALSGAQWMGWGLLLRGV